MKTTPWGGRFSQKPAETVKNYTQSVSFDARLYPHDIAGSVAHAKMLAKIGILSSDEAKKIERALREIEKEIASGKFAFDPALEDVHMNIETALVKKIGDTGKKLHTARSRNDQIALDLRLFMRAEISNFQSQIRNLQKSLVHFAEKNAKIVIPGYTHLQRAQPVPLAHHALAYVEMLERDHARLADCAKRANVCPLGSGAIAGSTLPLDREFVAKELGFDSVTHNSMDAVSDRDFIVEFLADAALIAAHLSRLAEDFVLWSSAEFGFITISDAYTTGSSLMPQKKNPDIAELARGKSGRVFGNLVAMLTILKGLPMTYNRDLQEDKLALFDTVDTVGATLEILAAMVEHTRVNAKKCAEAASDPLLLATDLVDFLVKNGTPFREAHHKVGELVAESERSGKPFPEIVAKKLGKNAAKILDLNTALANRTAIGAPSPQNVRAEIARWKKSLA
jgi:argininosuccinate lyase